MERHQSQGAASNSGNADVPSGDAAAAALFAVSRGLFSGAALAFTGSSGRPSTRAAGWRDAWGVGVGDGGVEREAGGNQVVSRWQQSLFDGFL